ncbi:hypothetical protein W02_31690 [Nitrospira sp. KM1]|uniref:hypothetical protein n=1 Tax=Nitrospira sp. KM1 TaxID=1936990 RepID=UPI0013A71E02|nr:hypothetical protein [Nitrospira sp. KM1]BCA56029.1 hypothetical protein W02_31690 [Nitrospira sp. KM1]
MSQPTMIGCPACAGGLELVRGPHGHVQLRCSVGHTFSLPDAYRAKEDELEYTQWSVVAILKHLQMLLAMMQDAPVPSDPSIAVRFQERAMQIEDQIVSLERIIQDTQVVLMSPSSKEKTGQ